CGYAYPRSASNSWKRSPLALASSVLPSSANCPPRRYKNKMRVTIRLPELGTPEARFSGWFVRVGDEVREGERLAEVLIPGVAVDVLAPAAGVLAERR